MKRSKSRTFVAGLAAAAVSLVGIAIAAPAGAASLPSEHNRTFTAVDWSPEAALVKARQAMSRVPGCVEISGEAEWVEGGALRTGIATVYARCARSEHNKTFTASSWSPEAALEQARQSMSQQPGCIEVWNESEWSMFMGVPTHGFAIVYAYCQ